MTAVWLDVRRLHVGMALVVLILVSIFAAAGAWETAYRLSLRAYAGDELLVRLAPPTRADLASVAGEVRSHFLNADLQAPRPSRALPTWSGRISAYALWKGSPLARHHSLSALVVETAGRRSPVVLLVRHAVDRQGNGGPRPRPLGGSPAAPLGKVF